MNIAFFVSDHGFGHIMRNLPVISELLSQGHTVVLVTGNRHVELATQYLKKESDISKLTCIGMNTDIGLIVKPGTLLVDEEATSNMVKEFVQSFPDRINVAKKIFNDFQVDRVVVDIVPWALKAAKYSGIKSYIMASFTWIEQYETYVDKYCLDILNDCFNDAQSVLMYEVANEPTLLRYPTHQHVGFVARPFHEEMVNEIKKMHKRPIVFMSIGGSNSGLEFDIDVGTLPYDFIATEGLRLKGETVTFLPVDIENTQDYIKAADYCISKAGWSSVAELMLSGNKTALLNRPDVPEDTMTIKELERRGNILSISVEELKDIGKIISRMEENIWSKSNYVNGYNTVAHIIVN